MIVCIISSTFRELSLVSKGYISVIMYTMPFLSVLFHKTYTCYFHNNFPSPLLLPHPVTSRVTSNNVTLTRLKENTLRSGRVMRPSLKSARVPNFLCFHISFSLKFIFCVFFSSLSMKFVSCVGFRVRNKFPVQSPEYFLGWFPCMKFVPCAVFCLRCCISFAISRVHVTTSACVSG